MQSIPWEAIGTTLAVFAFGVGSGAGLVRLTINAALDKFENRLLEKMNGRYLYRKEYDVIRTELERRLDRLEDAV